MGILVFCRRIPNFEENNGSLSVEVALLSPLFIFIVSAWIEIGLCLFMQSQLDSATRDASRLLRIGTATETDFKTVLCSKVTKIIPCASVFYKIQSSDSFSSLAPVRATSNGTFSSFGYISGSSGACMLIQVAYRKPVFFGTIMSLFGLSSTVIISSTVAFRSESY